ncbi:Usp domain-containing protein [Haematococcus lacustris]|uniref:Usp domain-containing protein n=1 Tax=Haematococcus lacustris TaxID=44745 RepID=A0A699Z2K6_HAELA|nr:Usp domain-containing protein [Haematococcus lacustris]
MVAFGTEPQVHVVPRIKFQASGYAIPAVDYIPPVDRDKYESVVAEAEAFIVRRFLSRMPADAQTTPIVHVIKSETDAQSIGHIICQKAEDVKATVVVMANHNRSAVADYSTQAA